ncbi:hypothetical protein EVC45_32155 [Paraburkholderia sp. UYCP14C]|uniref:alpha/beta hydrolase n=1 Tax=Paraburkholderia sp. UYCP14C TaxID=2511130 RepID=UPI00102079D6|nr:hypothetical protein EVC45_32155 [Paraburkholderia sp. UYCP14C]
MRSPSSRRITAPRTDRIIASSFVRFARAASRRRPRNRRAGGAGSTLGGRVGYARSLHAVWDSPGSQVVRARWPYFLLENRRDPLVPSGRAEQCAAAIRSACAALLVDRGRGHSSES